MTVKVVRGLVGTAKPSQLSQVKQSERPGQMSSLAARVTSSNPVASEAAIANVRGTKSIQTTDKIRDSKDARAVAKSVSQKIYMSETDAMDSHGGLSSAAAREML